MNTDPSTKPENLNTESDGVEKSIEPVIHETNITEGGEFLNDALRMNDLDPPAGDDLQGNFRSNKTFFYEFY